MSNHNVLRGMLFLTIVGGALPSAAVGQNGPKPMAVPRDPLELATGRIQAANSVASREAALQLLTRTRQVFSLRSARQAYDLKVRFTADSGGQTDHDGAWEMEDQFAPGLGLRWTAKSESGYAITGLFAGGKVYATGTAAAIPLRLHDARALLLDPVQSAAFAKVGTIRTVPATFRGVEVTCLLLSRSRGTSGPPPGRDWEETEECIDPQSGLLQVHSEVPGRYAVYEYANGPQFAGHPFPSSVTVMEGGRAVSKISVESLQATAAADPTLFIPSDAMKAAGQATAMTSATKIVRVPGAQGVSSGAAMMRPVCVFGMVSSTGHLVEAHVLQASDPNSRAALEDAKQIDFSPSIPPGTAPRQHFVFVIEEFAAQD